MIAPTFKARSTSPAVWKPGVPPPPAGDSGASAGNPPPPPPPPVWTPNSASASPQTQRKTFRPVHFEESPPTRRKFEGRMNSAEQNGTAGLESESRLRTSQSAPATGLNLLGTSSRLPKAQNPTVTLLQKAREGQLSRAPTYQQQDRDARLPRDRPSPPSGDPVHALRRGYVSEGEGERRARDSERKMSDAQKKIDGIGPITKDGMPVALRSEVKDPSRWYKKMYDTIHKNKYDNDYVTIRYKSRRDEPQRVSSSRSQYAYFDPRSGYLSEPEGGVGRLAAGTWSDAYDSDAATAPRRRTASVQEERRNDMYMSNNKYSTLASTRASQEIHKGQPGKIENYTPGKSSVVDKEAKQWWDEVMDIFDGWLDENTPLPPYSTLLARAIQKNQNISSTTSLPPKEKRDITSTILSKSNMARALKESGYESDSTLIFKRREDTEAPLSPAERRAAYRDLQAGGEPPLRGFRSPAPPRTEEGLIPPPPPRRISSRSCHTLKLVTAKPKAVSPNRTKVPSNVDLIKEKISNKLNRQNTVILRHPSDSKLKTPVRIASSSAPPALTKNKSIVSSGVQKSQHKTMESGSKTVGTSSFGSPRKTMSPIQYNTTCRSRYGGSSIVIEGGAGRKTPITNILDKVTPIDKLWGSQKRNERIDISKLRAKNVEKGKITSSRTVSNKPIITSTKSPISLGVTHKSRDMVRTSEKIQKLKFVNAYTQSTPCLVNKKDDRQPKMKTISNVSKSSSNICSLVKKSSNIKSPSINHLKKKKSLETITIKPKSPNPGQLNKHKYYSPQKSAKDSSKKDLTIYKNKEKYDGDTCSSQFGDDLSNMRRVENPKNINSKEIEKTHDAVMTNSFFQNLFCRNVNFPVVVDTSVKSNVKEKAKYFLSHPDYNINALPSALNTYLIHRKPVSLSKFKMWDKTSSPIRSESPRSISWPGRMDGRIRKFESLVNYSDKFGSSSSLSTVRSKSEPPASKLYFSQTSRPKSPVVIFHRKDNDETPPMEYYTSICNSDATSPRSIVYTTAQKKSISVLNKNVNKGPARSGDIIRPLSPHVNHFSHQYTDSKADYQDLFTPSTIFFSQTSRPVSPKVVKQSANRSRSHSTSPIPIRSPSYRRIHSAKTQHKSMIESRPRSVDSSNKVDILPPLKSKSKSDTIAQCNDPEYEEYVYDIQNAKKRSERFRELNRYYSYLERVGELEKSTSINDLRHRKRDEEIIDFDRWKKIRAIERAEEELNNLYKKLKIAQNEKDFLFYPRDVKDFRWNCDKERGLKVKEKSVEDLKDDFLQKSLYDSHDTDQFLLKDVYKPLWRGTSVAETAININRKNNQNEPVKCNSNVKHVKQSKELSIGDLRKKIGIGNRLWSSLSLDQVNALKDQLNAIYSKELESKSNKNLDKFTIEVKGERNNFNSNLHVRCSSLNNTNSPKTNEITKSESIAGICPVTTDKEIKNNVNKMQMVLSENEKKIISQTLSKEVIKRINKETTNQSTNNEPKKYDDESLIQMPNNKETNNVLNKLLDHKRHVIYASEKEEPTQSSASETETGGSDISNTTVIYVAPKKEVKKKVEYFESVQNMPTKDSILNSTESKASQGNKTLLEINKEQIPHSQSCTNIKELFGESEKNKFLSLPLKPDLHSRSPSPYSELYINDRRTPDTLRCSSDETIWRSRSPSPDTERYWQAYFKLARVGEVRRLARRFDSPSMVGGLRRHRSDPEITRNDIKNCLCTEKLGKQSESCKTSLTVARVPLRSKNRFMPHIDIISKLAALRRRTTPRSRSAEEAFECRPGEVERIRKRFEVMSILGQIYNSAPDVSELKDIAPYLEGSWIAHQYPKPSDNNRSIADPKTYVRGRLSPVKKEIKKSVFKEPLKLSSILKSDTIEGQQFDPSVHRPISRYEPPRAPPRPPPAEWPYKLASFVTPRNTVKFKENDSAPEPPRRMQHSSISDSDIKMNLSDRNNSASANINLRDDDGFYSDVPLSGSLSKSLLALNKYVKKNLLYDDSEDPEETSQNDGAYFSQESTPNDSVVKSDTESVTSHERVVQNNGTIIITKYTVTCESLKDTSDPTKQTDDYKFQQLLDNSSSISHRDSLSSNSSSIYTALNKNENDVHFSHENAVSKLNLEGEKCKEDDILNENSDDTTVNIRRHTVHFQNETESTYVDNKPELEHEGENITKNVILREKTGEMVVNPQRHTLHDFTNWGNRTDKYPDVYAPLPFKSPSRRYVESDVNIHYRCPVRHDPLPLVPERELARQQAEHMKQLYREQKRNKYLQENDYHDIDIQAFDASIKELQDMQNRRHQDNFMPSQKTVVPLNRYDEADRIIARALYTFNGQTSRELSFRKGDIIHVRRQIDNNWYEGEIHGRVGLFPYNYVELLKGDVAQSPKKPLILEGRARAKFDFTAQTNLELPLKKGELVVLTRRIDHNWWEGRLGNKTGIFPDSYVTILQEPSQSKPEPQPILSTAKPVASPAAHGLVNGDKRSLGAHSYTPQPNSPALGNAPPATQPLLGYQTKRPQSATPGERGYSSGVDLNNTEPLYVDTNAEAIPYRAMYKYRPQNPDELELNEGDTVYVLEKCDDGWYVGSSQRTGRFGTFPGNYVERI
ncbi:unnamed protein product [Colias eurytheme]|nr:unnamed protein product [Colias eurytheme]